MTRRARILVWILSCFAVWFVLAACVGIQVPGIEVVFYLVVGWVAYLVRVVPQVRVRWDVAGSFVVYCGAFLVGSHVFLRWLRREMAPAAPAWRVRWTASAFALVVLMFAAGIGAVGVVHQTAWLVRSPEPIYRRNHLRSFTLKCASNLKQISLAMQMYRADHGGRNPEDLAELLVNEDLAASVLNCPGANDVPAAGPTTRAVVEDARKPGHCSYVYLGRGLSEPIDPRVVMVYEAPENHEGEGFNVMYGDGRVEWVTGAEAEAVLARVRRGATRPAEGGSGGAM